MILKGFKLYYEKPCVLMNHALLRWLIGSFPFYYSKGTWERPRDIFFFMLNLILSCIFSQSPFCFLLTLWNFSNIQVFNRINLYICYLYRNFNNRDPNFYQHQQTSQLSYSGDLFQNNSFRGQKLVDRRISPIKPWTEQSMRFRQFFEQRMKIKRGSVWKIEFGSF